MTRSARDYANEAERALLPAGDDERFAGYGIMGLPFASGHVLALRRFPASSVGQGYRSIWHRDPSGAWTFYTDTEPRQSCNRYFGRAVAKAVVTTIDIRWPAGDRISARVPGVIEWESRLEQNTTARMMTTVGTAMPAPLWRSGPVLDLMSFVASRALGAGTLKLQGSAPNGQRFIANPKRIWFIPETHAMVAGVDLGPAGRLEPQAHLGDFMIPQRGIFAVGGAMFDVFDPSRHAAVATTEDAARGSSDARGSEAIARNG
jgi:hypothetical protein